MHLKHNSLISPPLSKEYRPGEHIRPCGDTIQWLAFYFWNVQTRPSWLAKLIRFTMSSTTAFNDMTRHVHNFIFSRNSCRRAPASRDNVNLIFPIHKAHGPHSCICGHLYNLTCFDWLHAKSKLFTIWCWCWPAAECWKLGLHWKVKLKIGRP